VIKCTFAKPVMTCVSSSSNLRCTGFFSPCSRACHGEPPSAFFDWNLIQQVEAHRIMPTFSNH
jgi:hypothetical protein